MFLKSLVSVITVAWLEPLLHYKSCTNAGITPGYCQHFNSKTKQRVTLILSVALHLYMSLEVLLFTSRSVFRSNSPAFTLNGYWNNVLWHCFAHVQEFPTLNVLELGDLNKLCGIHWNLGPALQTLEVCLTFYTQLLYNSQHIVKANKVSVYWDKQVIKWVYWVMRLSRQNNTQQTQQRGITMKPPERQIYPSCLAQHP